MKYKNLYNTDFYDIAYTAIENGDVTRDSLLSLVEERGDKLFFDRAFEETMLHDYHGGDPMESESGESIIYNRVWIMVNEMTNELREICMDLDFLESVTKEL